MCVLSLVLCALCAVTCGSESQPISCVAFASALKSSGIHIFPVRCDTSYLLLRERRVFRALVPIVNCHIDGLCTVCSWHSGGRSETSRQARFRRPQWCVARPRAPTYPVASSRTPTPSCLSCSTCSSGRRFLDLISGIACLGLLREHGPTIKVLAFEIRTLRTCRWRRCLCSSSG